MADENKIMTDSDIRKTFEHSPFIAHLGLEVVSTDPERMSITVRLPMQPHLERLPGTRQFHGGPIASLIDIVGDFAIGMLVGGGVPTINLRVDYLKPAIGDALISTARVRRSGRTIAIVDIDVFDERDSLVAVGRGTYASAVG